MAQARLIGLDFGSTTSHAMVASATILRNCVTGRMELGDLRSVYRPDPLFTPFIGESLDEARLAACLDRWVSEAKLEPADITAGGAIVTGLAAQASNAQAIVRMVRSRIGDAVIAVADDPRLESWLAFNGSCRELSVAEPETPFLNLDIGGGTTNLAYGRDGEVSATGCFFVGARHVQVVPGTYQLRALSRTATALLRHLKIDRRPGELLGREEVAAIVDFYVRLLEGIVSQEESILEQESAKLHEQAAIRLPRGAPPPVITLSGGVGELVYRHVRGDPLPGTTAYGDLGIDLALRLVRSPLLSRNLRTHVPLNLGHATVCGLALKNTEVSGTTLFLPRPDQLPLRDLPIVGRLSPDAPPREIRETIALAAGSSQGTCIEITSVSEDYESVKRLGEGLALAFRENPFPKDRPLVLFVPGNVGKAIGSYATEWGRLDVNLIVIDELAGRSARFASLGALCHGVVPVSFYGMH